jgi:hypothetical protein
MCVSKSQTAWHCQNTDASKTHYIEKQKRIPRAFDEAGVGFEHDLRRQQRCFEARTIPPPPIFSQEILRY